MSQLQPFASEWKVYFMHLTGFFVLFFAKNLHVLPNLYLKPGKTTLKSRHIFQ